MRIEEIINTLERCLKIEAELTRLSQEMSAVNDEYNREKAGVQRIGLRTRLTDLDKMIKDKRAELQALYDTLPPKDTIPYSEFCRGVAKNRMRLKELEAEKMAAEAELEKVQSAAKGNEWKWKARGEPPVVGIARKKVADIAAQIADVVTNSADDELYVKEEVEFEQYGEELAAWTPGTPFPERYRRAEAERIGQMEFVAIPLPKRSLPRLLISEMDS